MPTSRITTFYFEEEMPNGKFQRVSHCVGFGTWASKTEAINSFNRQVSDFRFQISLGRKWYPYTRFKKKGFAKFQLVQKVRYETSKTVGDENEWTETTKVKITKKVVKTIIRKFK